MLQDLLNTKDISMKKLSLLMLLSLATTTIMVAAAQLTEDDERTLRSMMYDALVTQRNVAKAAQLLSIGAQYDIQPSCYDVQMLIQASAEALQDETIFKAFSQCMDYPTELHALVSDCARPHTLDALKKLHAHGVRVSSRENLKLCESQINKASRESFLHGQDHELVIAYDESKVLSCQAVHNFLVEASAQDKIADENALIQRLQALKK